MSRGILLWREPLGEVDFGGDWLKVLVKSSILSFKELRTFLVEIETVINSRPFTYLYDDVDSISYPLTSFNLIYGRCISLTPNSAHHEIVSTYRSLTRRARHHRDLLSQLTEQWKQEHLLTSLREQSIAKVKPNKRSTSVGNVLMQVETCSRPDSNGKIRSAKVKVWSSDIRPIYLRRIVQHLIPIEVNENVQE